MVQDHIDLLGLPVHDRVTNFAGAVTTISFDLYGCIQAIVTPPCGADGSAPEGRWFDVSRLSIDSMVRVMDVPNFNDGSTRIAQGKKGAADKPLP